MDALPQNRPVVLDVRSDAPEVVADVAWSLGALGLEERGSGPRITFPDADTAAAARATLARYGTVVDASAALDTDWVGNWRPHARVHRVEPFVVRPPWIDRPVPREPGIEMVVDPGGAFGHGGHPSTQLLLRQLPALVDASTTVLDVGCGSGILAIAASLLGAASVTAIDVDPAAVAITRANAERNQCRLQASTDELAAVSEPFDLVVVNVTAATMADLAAELRRVTGNRLVVSGLLVGQSVPGLDELTQRDEQDGWILAALTCD